MVAIGQTKLPLSLWTMRCGNEFCSYNYLSATSHSLFFPLHTQPSSLLLSFIMLMELQWIPQSRKFFGMKSLEKETFTDYVWTRGLSSGVSEWKGFWLKNKYTIEDFGKRTFKFLFCQAVTLKVYIIIQSPMPLLTALTSRRSQNPHPSYLIPGL